MLKIIKLHLGLIKYLSIEIKKKRSLKEWVKFIFDLIKSYFRELYRLAKMSLNIFDANYRKQVKQYKQQQQIQEKLKVALKMLRYIDQKMIKNGKSRQERRAFWRDFYSNSQIRKEVFDDLTKETEGLK